MQGAEGGRRALGALGGPSVEVWSCTASLGDLGTEGYLPSPSTLEMRIYCLPGKVLCKVESPWRPEGRMACPKESYSPALAAL